MRQETVDRINNFMAEATKDVEFKKFVFEYPKLMTQGTANVPQRFWSYAWAENKEEEQELRDSNFILSTLKPNSLQTEDRDLPPFRSI